MSFLIPDWPAPLNVRALFTDRHGGVSLAPYNSLNLGDHVGDQTESVSINREILSKRIQGEPIFLNQVHGVDAIKLDKKSLDGTSADACFTEEKELACTIMVADCLPILLADRMGRRIAAAHAGWRGLAGSRGWGVVESVVKSFMQPSATLLNGIEPEDIFVWLGPCIGPKAFEVGGEVRDIFIGHSRNNEALFQPSGSPNNNKWLADLGGLARLRLNDLGIVHIFGNNGTDGWCSFMNSNFFSYRRDRLTGRMAACIWLT